MIRSSLALVLLTSVLITSSSYAAILYDEDTMGDLSNIDSAPTVAGSTVIGDNTISGLVDNGFGIGDRDILTFSVLPGQQISSFMLNAFTGSGGHFFGFAPGTIAPTSPGGYYFAGLVFDGSTPIDILSSGGGSFGGTGVPAVLGAGDYTVFFNETAAGVYFYQAQIEVTAVPEPTTALVLLPLGYAAYRRRKAVKKTCKV